MESNYVEKIKRYVGINKLYRLTHDDIWEIFDTSKAIIIDGHFELLSKKHTDTFFRFSLISQFPYLVAKISKELVSWLQNDYHGPKIDVILGPTSQGMFFAYDMAREYSGENKTRAVYAEIDKETGRPTKRIVDGKPTGLFVAGFGIKKGENVLVVNDMTTTGSGLEILINTVKNNDANVVGVCVFGNRGINESKIKTIKNNYMFHSIIELNMPYWPKNECQLCLEGKGLIESRQINHLPLYSTENAYDLLVQRLRIVG
jgi:orotate phosphoribosyltransferase